MRWLLTLLLIVVGFVYPAAAYADDSTEALESGNLTIDGTVTPQTGADNMDGELYTLSQAASKGASLQDLQNTSSRLVFDDQERVQIQLYITGDNERSARKTVVGLGGLIEQAAVSDGEEGLILQCWLPPSALQSAADSPFVNYVRTPAYIQMYETLNLGAETTQGVTASNADAWQSAGLTGSGVKVMVIDGGFQGWESLVAVGELPTTTVAQTFIYGESYASINTSGGTHGSACAEIVADMAPGIQLYLAKIQTNADLPEAVTWAISLGVDVISTSIGWDYVTAGDGYGPLADQVQRARDAGIFWATAAGNEAEKHLSGDYPIGSGYYEFSSDVQIAVLYNALEGDTGDIIIRWSDWAVFDQNLTVVLAGYDADAETWVALDNSIDATRPIEYLSYTLPSGYAAYGVSVWGESISEEIHFDIKVHGGSGNRNNTFVNPDPNHALCDLADSPAAVTVGALDAYFVPYALEDYSSGGPTNGPGGIGTSGADKPEIAAYANVLTASYAGYLFNGTSAATPHVAGLAALVAQACPLWGPDEIEAYLTGTALDVEDTGYDLFTGYGRLLVPDSTPSAGTATPTSTPTVTATPSTTPTATATATSTPTHTPLPTLDPSMTHVMLPLVLK